MYNVYIHSYLEDSIYIKYAINRVVHVYQIVDQVYCILQMVSNYNSDNCKTKNQWKIVDLFVVGKIRFLDIYYF